MFSLVKPKFEVRSKPKIWSISYLNLRPFISGWVCRYQKILFIVPCENTSKVIRQKVWITHKKIYHDYFLHQIVFSLITFQIPLCFSDFFLISLIRWQSCHWTETFWKLSTVCLTKLMERNFSYNFANNNYFTIK